jgi:hypothetical protein
MNGRNHKPNVYVDLSGGSPNISAGLVRYIKLGLRDKMLFGRTGRRPLAVGFRQARYPRRDPAEG